MISQIGLRYMPCAEKGGHGSARWYNCLAKTAQYNRFYHVNLAMYGNRTHIFSGDIGTDCTSR
jgi:hypothetical protein